MHYRFHYITLKTVVLYVFIFLNFSYAQSSFSGYIKDASSKKGISNVLLSIAGTGINTMTDTNGFFILQNLSPGNYDVVLTHQNYITEKIIINTETGTDSSIFFMFEKSYQTPVIIVSENRTIENYMDLLEESNVLTGKELQRHLSNTLAATLKDEIGLSMRSLGPAPSRPVYRGLTGDRILITEDGNKVNDISATSLDHAVTVEPFSATRIEVLRGPRILLQTPTTIGGVINVIHNDIPLIPVNTITGTGGVYGESSNNGYLGGLSSEIPLKPFMFSFEVNGRKASNLHTPLGELNNTALSNYTIAGGSSFIKNKMLLGISYRQYISDYGIPGGFYGSHPDGISINLKRRHLNVKFEKQVAASFLRKLNVELNKTYFYQAELERSDLIGAEFEINDYDGKVDITHVLSRNAGGTFGTSFDYRDFKVGGYVFTPFTKSYKQSLYLYENVQFKKSILELGARYEYNSYDPYDTRFVVPSRVFNTISVSLSGILKLMPDLYVSGNVSRSTRVPTTEELYSQGPHLAAYSYEVGNPELNYETGICAEASMYYTNSLLYAMITAFRNDFSYYISLRNTGDTNYATLLPIYKSSGEAALLYGVESQLKLTPFTDIELNATLSYTFGKFKNTNTPLPSIPPLKIISSAQYSHNSLTVGIGSEVGFSQERVDDFEQPTPGYAIFNSYLQYAIPVKRTVHSLSLTCDNIFNTVYYNHLSRTKFIMPEAGTSLKFTYKIFF